MDNVAEVEIVRKVLQQYGYSQEKLLSILLDIQNESENNYLSEECTSLISRELGIPIDRLYDVITFYSMLNLQPKGKYIIEICKSSICHIGKYKEIAALFENILGIHMGENTPDNLFSLKYTSCFGACDKSPAVKIGEKIYSELNAEKVQNIIKSYREGVVCQA